MKKILQINSVLNFGSTGRIAEGIGQAAIRHGWESYIAYGRNQRDSQSRAIKVGNDWDIKFHVLQTRVLDRQGLASNRATNELVEEIEEIKPDIIHLHNLHGYYLNFKVLFDCLKCTGIPVVWTFHDCWPITGHCAYFSFVGCQKWKTQCEHCPQKTKYPASYGLDRSYQNYCEKKSLFTSISQTTMVLVPVSYWLNNIIAESFLKRFTTKVIYNGVDINTFFPQDISDIRKKYRLEGRHVLLGVASSWSERKGLQDYLQLSRTLRDDELIVLVGLKEKQIEKLPPRIMGIKRTENLNELAALYSLADVVCNLSVEETFGLTTVEGFACGTPGIVYNCTASPELINSDTGFIVEAGDIEGVRSAIDVIRNRGKSSYSSACRERAVKMFNKDSQYEQYIQLYEELLANK